MKPYNRSLMQSFFRLGLLPNFSTYFRCFTCQGINTQAVVAAPKRGHIDCLFSLNRRPHLFSFYRGYRPQTGRLSTLCHTSPANDTYHISWTFPCHVCVVLLQSTAYDIHPEGFLIVRERLYFALIFALVVLRQDMSACRIVCSRIPKQ